MTDHKARKAAARALAQADGISYTSALRHVVSAVDMAGSTRPPSFEVWTEHWDGPSWGGGLHTHGVTVTVTGRADDGSGDWLTPQEWRGDRTELEQAVRLVAQPDGGFDVDWDHLDQVLTTVWPGARIVAIEADPEHDDLDQDDDPEITVLTSREFRRDCVGDCGAHY